VLKTCGRPSVNETLFHSVVSEAIAVVELQKQPLGSTFKTCIVVFRWMHSYLLEWALVIEWKATFRQHLGIEFPFHCHLYIMFTY